MIFLFFTSPLAPLEAEICPIEVLYGISIVLQVGANSLENLGFIRILLEI